jgi:adenosine deaminase
MLEDASFDNVIYLEVRTGPKILNIDHHHQQQQEQYCTKKEYVQTILDAMQDFETTDRIRYEEAVRNTSQDIANNDNNMRLPMIPRLLISIDRSGTVDQAMENVQLAIEMSRSTKYIVGVELGGNPTRSCIKQ